MISQRGDQPPTYRATTSAVARFLFLAVNTTQAMFTTVAISGGSTVPLMIIPGTAGTTTSAAPTSPTVYHIGGMPSYLDQATGQTVSVALHPTAITVYPPARGDEPAGDGFGHRKGDDPKTVVIVKIFGRLGVPAETGSKVGVEPFERSAQRDSTGSHTVGPLVDVAALIECSGNRARGSSSATDPGVKVGPDF